MSPPPLFTLDPGVSSDTKVTVNLLPCRIHHDGDVNPSDTYWNPIKTQGEESSQTAYLRGRKLHGKSVAVPEGYRGVVVEKTDAKPESGSAAADDDVEMIDNPKDQLDVGTMRGRAAFDELVVWGHESTADSAADPFVRGMEEWIAFSAQIHSFDEESESTKSS